MENKNIGNWIRNDGKKYIMNTQNSEVVNMNGGEYSFGFGNETYMIHGEVRVSTAHIIDFTETKCNRLHGHNYLVKVDVLARALEKGMVIDFLEIKKVIGEIDHYLVISNRQMVSERNGYVNVNAGGRKYRIPREVVKVLDIEYTTAEEMAKYFALKIGNRFAGRVIYVCVRVYETENLFAEYIDYPPEDGYRVKVGKASK